MTSTIHKAQRLADNAATEGERQAALAAVERLKASSPTRGVVQAKATVPADPFGERVVHKKSGPRPVRLLHSHQRKAWLALAAGGGKLSRNENSFLHRMRESSYISPAQERWLNDIDLRLKWEAGIR